MSAKKQKRLVLQIRGDTMQEQVAKILLETGAVTLRPNKPFRYVSGILSPIYVDNKIVLSYPKKRKTITNSFLKIIKERNLEFDIIAGVATSGIPDAAWLADQLNKPMIMVRTKASDPINNSVGISVPITVNNVPPSPYCHFEEGRKVALFPSGFGTLMPEEHNIYVYASDPGNFDYPWTINIDFGDGSSELIHSDSSDAIIHHPYEPGHYVVKVQVTDKDGGSGTCACEFDVLCTEDEAKSINAGLKAQEQRVLERLVIMQAYEEWERASESREREKPAIPRHWADNTALQRILDGIMVAHIKMSDGSTLTFKMVFEKGNLKEIDEINQEEAANFKPSAEIYTSGSTMMDIIQSDNPTMAFKDSFEHGDINIKGVGAGNKIKYGFAVFRGRIVAKFID